LDKSAEQKALNPATSDQAVQNVNKDAIGDVASFHNRNAAQRKSFVDPTAQPWFGHAEDYSVLTGEVQYSPFEKSWRLRYASLDESDPYGGSVTLIGVTKSDALKDGDYVRVQGHLVSTERKESAPPYKVSSVQPIENR
jgi:hypothetical protein